MQENEILENTHRVLRRLRLNAEEPLTQEAIANAICIHKSSYNQLETGKRNMYILDIIRIAHFYGITMSALAALLERTPDEVERIGRLQLELDAALKENTELKLELDRFKQ